MKINSLKKQKHGYLIHSCSDKTFKGIDVDWTCHPINGSFIEITVPVPLKLIIYRATTVPAVQVGVV